MQKTKEVWKQVKISKFKGTYCVSSSGKIKKLGYFLKTSGKWSPSKLMSPQIHSRGYVRVNLSKGGFSKSYYVHRLVAMFFIPNTLNKPCINHKDGNKLNNHYLNLEWCTVDENNEHAIQNGLVKDPPGLISKEDRRFIVENILIVGRKALAEKFGVSEKYVLSIARINGVSVKGTKHGKKAIPRHKEIIDTETGKYYISDTLAEYLKTSRKEVVRMLNEERKPNTSPYRYTGRYVNKKVEECNT